MNNRNRNNKAEMKNVVIGVIIVLAAVLLVIAFYFVFPGKSGANQPGASSLETEPASQSLNQEKWCIAGEIMIKENFPEEGQFSDFKIIRKIIYHGIEICDVRNMAGEEYYFNEQGDKNFKVSIERGRRVITPLD